MKKFLRSILSLLFVFVACSDKHDNFLLESNPKFSLVSDSILESYIVVLKEDITNSSQFAQDIVMVYGGQILFNYTHALHGFSARLPIEAVDALMNNPMVKYLEQDGEVSVQDTQFSPSSWGLNRIDQRLLPLDESYIYTSDGTGVHVYILDTGIRVTHYEFEGRATGDFTSIIDGRGTYDCHGHGTHVAGTVGGTTYGVAKKAALHAVRVLDCNGVGTWSGVIAGIDWVTENQQKPAVVNMSLGGGLNLAVNEAVDRSTALGVLHVVAAGNNNADACNYSPASASSAITLGATDVTDARASFSNYGSCVDIFAPGVGILSAYKTTDSASTTLSGTSMASPHVAGIAALFLQLNPDSLPEMTTRILLAFGTVGVVKNIGAGSPDLLAYSIVTDSLLEPPPPPPPPPPPNPIDSMPIADFQVRGCPHSICKFSAQKSYDDKGIVSYVWNFGDGSREEILFVEDAVHEYLSPGRYLVQLKVTDTSGQEAQVQKDIAIRK